MTASSTTIRKILGLNRFSKSTAGGRSGGGGGERTANGRNAHSMLCQGLKSEKYEIRLTTCAGASTQGFRFLMSGGGGR